jgi:hypothetical protein
MQARIYKKDKDVVVDVFCHSWIRGKDAEIAMSEYIIPYLTFPYTLGRLEIIEERVNRNSENYYDYNVYTNYLFYLNRINNYVVFTALVAKYKTRSCYEILREERKYKIFLDKRKNEIIVYRIIEDKHYIEHRVPADQDTTIAL